MATETKGIEIEFRGNTVSLDDSIDGVNKALKLTQSEYKSLTQEMKKNGTTAENNEKAQKLLQQRVELLKEAISKYKQQIADLNANGIKTNEDVKQLQTLSSQLASAEAQLNRYEQQLQNVSTASIKDFGKSCTELSNNLSKVEKTLTSVGKALSVVSATTGALLTTGVKYNAEMEQLEVGLNTILGSEQEVQKVISDIKADAQATPFSTKDLIAYNRMLLSTGVSAEESESAVLALGNAISATGGDSNTMERMIQNLQQIKNAGSATAMDLKQFAYAYIDIYGILADYLGKDVADVETSDATYENIVGALEKASQEGGKYYGAMEAQSETLSASVTKLKESFNELLGELTESLMPIIKQLVEKLKELTAWFDSLSQEQKDQITKWGLILTAIGPVLLALGKIVGIVSSITGTMGKLLTNSGVLSWLGSLQTMLAEQGIMGALSSLGETLTSTAGIIGIIITAIISMYTCSADFRQEINELVSIIGGTLWAILQTIGGFITETLIPAIQTICAWAGDNLAPVIDLINYALKDVLIPILQTLWSFISTYLLPILSSMAELVGGILKTAFDTIGTAIQVVVSVVESLFDGLGYLYEQFENSAVFDTFSGLLDGLVSAVQTVIDVVSSLFGWIDKVINGFKDMFSLGSKTDSISSSGFSSGGYGYRSGGYASQGYASGGITLNNTFNITNGNNIDSATVQSWSAVMVDYINEELGKAI